MSKDVGRSPKRLVPNPNQRYHHGDKVWIKADLPEWMMHFQKGVEGIVTASDYDRYGQDGDTPQYTVVIDGNPVSWYPEWALEPLATRPAPTDRSDKLP
jgi:hypothetical protein